jgi:hypothetical protein
VVDIVAVPAEAVAVTDASTAANPIVIPLHRDVPLTFRLRDGGLDLPAGT